ncbi:MAG TPA: DNA circularization N-terminal domain-containing protein [Acetobacteraceae bacterium]|nr:DNA circularization N-terminal domain-containing protein [Acetobacteraceae bacterium]
MSGFTGITGFAPPTSIAGFLGLLQVASFRGVPFKVIGEQVKKGRRLAVHQYPFRDGGWPEDMGRALRTYSFTGYLIGDIAPAMQLALDTALEAKGPGILVHPTIGAVSVDVGSATSAVHRDRMRVISFAFEFIEHSGTVSPSAIIATAVAVLLAGASALLAANSDLGSVAGPAAALGPTVIAEGVTTVTAFTTAVTLGGADPTGIISMAAGLPPPDANTSYGRYAAGSTVTLLPVGTTVASLQAQLVTQRQATAAAAATVIAAAASYSAATDLLTPLSTMLEAMRAGITDPADQVRVLVGLAAFTYTDTQLGTVGIPAAAATIRDAMVAACAIAAGVSLAYASAAYQPVSYNDAAALRLVMTNAFDTLVTTAGDAEQDASYAALKILRGAVIQDLTVRGAALPSVVTVRLPQNMPSLAIAQRLYQDASRSDQIAAEAVAPHPAFCPLSFQVLSA